VKLTATLEAPLDAALAGGVSATELSDAAGVVVGLVELAKLAGATLRLSDLISFNFN
jgi:hypothetical protein